MTVFLLFAALMLAAALFFVLPPLLQKEQAGMQAQREAINLDILRDQLRELDADREAETIDAAGYDAARHELEQRVAEEVRPELHAAAVPVRKPWAALALAVLLPVLAGALYTKLGAPDGLDPAKTAPESAQQYTPEQISAMVDKLALEMKDRPDDFKGWTMLARTYAKLGRFPEASQAYAHLTQLMPHNADLLAEYAEVQGYVNHQSLIGEPEKIIQQALDADPKNVAALAISGAAHFERHDYQGAVTQWRKILALVPPDSDIAHAVSSRIDQALSLSGMPAEGAVASGKPVSLTGTIDLDPALRAQVKDDDTVFVFARAVNGPPMPLAVLRKTVKDLPISFTLDDSMSMMPNAKLSGFADVVVGARVSKSGNPMPAAGDLEGVSSMVHPGAKGLKIRIDSVHK